MKRENKIEVVNSLENFIINIVDNRISFFNKKNQNQKRFKTYSSLLSQPINMVLPLGWHPLKVEKLKTLHQFLYCFGIIIIDYTDFETHFIGNCKDKILWIGNQTELMYLISELIHPLKLIPPPAKSNLNIFISEHFRELKGDFDPASLKVSKSKGVGKNDRLHILNEIIEALK